MKIILMTDQDQGYLFIEMTLEKVGTLMAGHSDFPWYEVSGKKYLEDYINIGFYPGRDKAIAALAADFRGMVGDKGFYGNDISDWLDDAGVESAADIDLVFTIDCAGAQDWWVRFWYLDWEALLDSRRQSQEEPSIEGLPQMDTMVLHAAPQSNGHDRAPTPDLDEKTGERDREVLQEREKRYRQESAAVKTSLLPCLSSIAASFQKTQPSSFSIQMDSYKIAW